MTKKRFIFPEDKVTFESGKKFAKDLHRLHMKRKRKKQPRKRGSSLSKASRRLVLDKTDSKCHICGSELTIDNFQADHVKSHIHGGGNQVENFLPSCNTCNNYRWHYLPNEIKWILKLGVWAKTQIEDQKPLGIEMGERFITYEKGRIRKGQNRKKKKSKAF